MDENLSDTSLGGYGVDVYERDHFTCVYCGFDGRPFDSWMQLSIDPVRPQSQGGTDAISNMVCACKACNSITSRMKFEDLESPEEIIEKKRTRIAERRVVFYEKWRQYVGPHYLDRPLPPVGPDQ